jgi:hypothetical protein
MYEDLIFVDSDVEYLKLTIDMTVYWTGAVTEHREGIMVFYEKAMGCLGNQFTHYETAQMTGFRTIDSYALNLIPDWTNRPEGDGEFRSLKLEGSGVPNVPSDTALGFWSVPFKDRRVGALKLVLPVGFGIETDRLRTLGTDLAGKLRLHSGHMGYSVNWDYRGRYALRCRRAMGWLARRFPGIDLPDVHCTMMALPYGIKRISWLTLVGKAYVTKLGGIDCLSESIADARVGLELLPHALLIEAGQAPGIGDVNRRERLEAYHSVGRAVSSIRSRRHPPFLASAHAPIDEDLSAEWLAHFDN